ncbi:MAG TPA: DedA family protein [Bacteroidetes bacterium]|nr:DedA family protein [Bacteroidota bacterium]
MLNLAKDHKVSYPDLNGESRRKLSWIKISLILGIIALSSAVYFSHLLSPRYHELLVYFLIMSISCNLIPIPTYPFVLYVSPDYAPLLIAFVGAVGATLSALLEYYILDFLLGFRRLARIKENPRYKRYAGYFDRFSFGSVFLASAIPMPVDPVRMLAISRGYEKWRFALATFIGRIPRFFLIALLGSQLVYAKRIAVLLLIGTLALELVRRVWKILIRQPAVDQGF